MATSEDVAGFVIQFKEVAGDDCRMLLCKDWSMGKDETADEHARAIEWLREVEAAAAELVEVGDLLFGRGEPSDPANAG